VAYHRAGKQPALFALAALMLVAAPGSAQPPQSVSSCTTLNKAGLYVLDAGSAPVSPSVPGDCFVITASKVVFDLNSAMLVGLGTGAGIHVMSSATDVLIEGHNSVISGFNEGIEIDGSKNIAENFTVTRNFDAGVLLNRVKQTKLNNFMASYNGTDGVRISKGSYNSIAGAANPGVDGSVTLEQNGRYGLWLFATSYNSIGGFTAENNAVAGVYLGCSTAFPSPCSKNSTSNYNSIFDGDVIAVNGGSEPYGVAIDLGDGNNRVTNISSLGEDLAAVTDDLIDQNSDCGTNDWFANSISGQTSPSWDHTSGCMD